MDPCMQVVCCARARTARTTYQGSVAVFCGCKPKRCVWQGISCRSPCELLYLSAPGQVSLAAFLMCFQQHTQHTDAAGETEAPPPGQDHVIEAGWSWRSRVFRIRYCYEEIHLGETPCFQVTV